MSGIALLMIAGLISLPLAVSFWMGWWAVFGRDVHPSRGRPTLR
jgi:hypothetical protein